jgi:alanine dehydrogenase
MTTKDNSIINAKLLEEYNLQYLKENNDLITSVKKATEKQLLLHVVSKSVAKQYAEFCVRCDREELPLLELDDYIKQYCC